MSHDFGVFSFFEEVNLHFYFLISSSEEVTCSLYFQVFFVLVLAVLSFIAMHGFSPVMARGVTLQSQCMGLLWRLLCFLAQALGTRASVVAARGLSSCGSQALGGGLVVVAHGLNHPMARGIFLDQGLNPFLLYWQAYSYTVYHQCFCSFRTNVCSELESVPVVMND